MANNLIRVKQLDQSELSGFFAQTSINTGLISSIVNSIGTGIFVSVSGDQNVSGTKTFFNSINISGDLTVNGSIRANEIIDFTVTGDISGYTGQFQALFVKGQPVLTGSFATPSTVFETGKNLYNYINALSGTLNNSGSVLYTYITQLSGDFDTSGAILNSYINNLSGDFNQTGALLNNYINDLSGVSVLKYGDQNISGIKTFASRPTVNGTGVLLSGEAATSVDLASTGSTLNTRINNLSGYINSTSSNIVFTTGNQTISGIKTFAENTTFGDTGQGDFLVISGNNFTVYGSGNFTSGLSVNGNPVLTGVDLSSYATIANLASTGSTLDNKINNLSGVSVLTFGNQTITGNKIFNSLRIEPSGRAFTLGTGLNINSESGIVRINTNITSSFGAGFTYALNSGVDPNRPLDIEGRGRLVHGLSLDAGSSNFTSASDHFHLFFSAGPNNPGSFNGAYSTATNTNYKSYQFSPTTRPNGNDNLRDLIHLTTLEAKGANDQAFPTSALTELYLTTTGTVVVTPPGTGLVELAYAINSQPTSQYLHATGDTVYLRVFPGVAGIVANTYNGTVVRRITGLDPAYGSTNVYKVGVAVGALNINNNFVPAQRGTSTQTDAWALSRNTTSSAFTGITRIERNSSQYLDQFNVFYASPITGYTGETVVVDVFNRGLGTFIASGITLTQARYDGYVSKVLSPTGLEITLSLMNFGSLGGVGRPGSFHNPPLTTGSAFISSEDLVTGMQILRGSSDAVHRNYWAHNVFAGFRNLDATDLNVPAGVITRVAVGGLNRVESGSTSALGFNNKAYGFNSHAYGAHQENYNRNSVRIGATTESYINIVSGRLGVNIVNPSATIDIGTGNIIAGNVTISGHLSATSKSFLIDHPTQIHKKLQYGSLEGPEHGVFVRGKTNENIINLPNYWPSLVDKNSISVNLTPISAANNIYVVDYNNQRVITNGNNGNDYFYTVYGERKDIPKLTVEF